MLRTGQPIKLCFKQSPNRVRQPTFKRHHTGGGRNLLSLAPLYTVRYERRVRGKIRRARVKFSGLLNAFFFILMFGFQAMLDSNWSESRQQVIHLQEDPQCVEVFPTFLKYFYTGTIWLGQTNVVAILVLADKYNILVQSSQFVYANQMKLVLYVKF